MVKQEYIFNVNYGVGLKESTYNFGFVDGTFGAGKTLFLTHLAERGVKDYDYIFANYHIDINNCFYLDKINKDVLLGLNDEREYKCLLLLHECYHYFDKQAWATKKNREIVQTLFQIRKLNIDIFCDIPEMEYLNFRVIKHANMFIHAFGELSEADDAFMYCRVNPELLYGNEYNFSYVPPYFIEYMKPIYELYNTFERHRSRQKSIISFFDKQGRFKNVVD